jgi:hypothetical protein
MAEEAVGRNPEIGDQSRMRLFVSPDGERTPTRAVVVAVAGFE